MAAPEHVVVRAMGVAVGIPVTDAETAGRIRHQWSRAVVDVPAEVVLEEAPPIDDPIAHDYSLSVRLTLEALRATAGQRLNIHAGAVADEAGRALCVVGESGSGKTTAIRALAARLGYLSDETVSLDEDLAVHPYPKPLSVVLDPEHPRHKQSVSPDDAGMLTPPEHCALHRIVLLRRGDDTHRLVPVSTAEAMVEIVPQTSSLIQLEHPLLTLARTIDRCGGAFALHYAEADDHLDDLVDLLGEELPAPPSPIHHPPPAPATSDSTLWRRAPWLDAVQYDDELVVMIDDTAHLVGGIGTTAWLALATPASLPDVVAAAVDAHGPHPEAQRLVEEALEALGANGVVLHPTATPTEA